MKKTFLRLLLSTGMIAVLPLQASAAVIWDNFVSEGFTGGLADINDFGWAFWGGSFGFAALTGDTFVLDRTYQITGFGWAGQYRGTLGNEDLYGEPPPTSTLDDFRFFIYDLTGYVSGPIDPTNPIYDGSISAVTRASSGIELSKKTIHEFSGSISPALLAPGTYMLSIANTAIGSDYGPWFWTELRDPGVSSFLFFGTSAFIPDDGFAPYFRIEGTTVPVPEPTTVFLLGTGLVGLVGCARRRARHESEADPEVPIDCS